VDGLFAEDLEEVWGPFNDGDRGFLDRLAV
jgi:hypothetical protein